MKTVVLPASSIAAIVGRHAYKPRAEIFDELWKKYSPATFTGITKSDAAKQSMNISSDAVQCVKAALAVKTTTSTESEAVFVQASQRITADPKLNTVQKKQVIEEMRSQIYTQHGTTSEDRTAEKVEVAESVKLVRDNAFYRYRVCVIEQTEYVIIGRVDRIEEKPDGTRVLVEIKNRMNRLFMTLVEYENIQIQTYLQMMKLDSARLVEQYNNTTNSIDIKKDDTLWNHVLIPELNNFCCDFHAATTLPRIKS